MLQHQTSSLKTARFLQAALLLLLLVFHVTPALAYLDPGTGSILLQGVIASIAAALAAGGVFWHRIKETFLSLFSSSDTSVTEPETEQSD